LLTLRVYLHSFSRCWLLKLRNLAMFREYLRIRSYCRSRLSKVIDLDVSQKRIFYATSY